MQRRLFLGALIAGATSNLAHAQSTLSARDVQDIRRAQTALESLKTLKARFLQTDPQGRRSNGSLWLSRPGKLRVEYDTEPTLLVADGRMVTHYDKVMKSVSNVPINSTPLGPILKNRINLLERPIQPLAVSRQPNILRIRFTQSQSPRDGWVELALSDRGNRINLLGWTLQDARGSTSLITLNDVETDVALDANLFSFVDPSFFQNQSNN